MKSAILKKKAENGFMKSNEVAPSKPRKRGRWDLQQTPEEVARKKSAWDEAGSRGATPGGTTPGGTTPGGTTPGGTTPGGITPGRATPGGTTPGRSNWDETPGRKDGETPGGATPSTRMWDATPGATTPGHGTPATPGRKNRWDMTPKWENTPRADGGETPGRAGWQETPHADRSAGETGAPEPRVLSSENLLGGTRPLNHSATPVALQVRTVARLAWGRHQNFPWVLPVLHVRRPRVLWPWG